MRVPWLGTALAAVLAVSASCTGDGTRGSAAVSDPPDGGSLAPPPALRVEGNRLIDSAGRPLILRGVNRMGLEFSCVQGKGLFHEPFDQRSIDAIKSWKLNVVRLPLNEHCWLGIGGEPSGERYRQGIAEFVDLLVSNELYVILDLHWSAPRSRSATALDAMPNADHSVDFWASVATRFKGEDRVIFDLFNEPVPNSNQRDDTDEVARRSWQCWRDGAGGGTCDAVQLGGMARSDVAGMQSLVDAVRATGATNVIMLSGIQFANTLWSNARRNWLSYRPVDPLDRLIASFHAYNDTWCKSVSCFEAEVAPIAAHVPVVAAEIGNAECDAPWMTALLDWLDQRGIGYLAWTWNAGAEGDCASKKLIVDEAGTPSRYGEIYKAHLGSLSPPRP
jgi:endoglucanase